MSATDRSIIRDALAVSLATGAYGISFGAIAVTSGLNVWQTCALSLLVFTGASQYALVGVIGAGGAPISGMLTGLLLGTRNTLYGLRLAPLLGFTGATKYAAAQLVIDESTAMSVTRETREEARTGFWWTGLGVFTLWNLATLIGAIAGDKLGDPRRYGLDAAVGGAFLALLWPRLNTKRNRLAAFLGIAVALALVPVVPAGVPVLAAATVAVGMTLLARDHRPSPGADQPPEPGGSP